jgi:hypothetical protein
MKSLKENERFIASGFGKNGVNDSEEDNESSPEEEVEVKQFDNQQYGNEDGNGSDEGDYEYEEIAGEYALYDSPLEHTDELMHIKIMLDSIYRSD